MGADQLQRIPCLYHFTDVANLPGIRRLDGLFSTANLRLMEEVFSAGGDESSLALDAGCGMDGFVHLCFTTNHPMAFRLRERKPEIQLTYLKIDRSILYQPGVKFATGVAYASGVETATLEEAIDRQLIDFTALYSRTDWREAEAQRRRGAVEKYELLVPDYVALTFIQNMPNG